MAEASAPKVPELENASLAAKQEVHEYTCTYSTGVLYIYIYIHNNHRHTPIYIYMPYYLNVRI